MRASPTELAVSLAESAVKEWPFTVGFLSLFIAHIAYYGILDHEWRIGGPPLFIAIAVLLLAELARQLFRRYRNQQLDPPN